MTKFSGFLLDLL